MLRRQAAAEPSAWGYAGAAATAVVGVVVAVVLVVIGVGSARDVIRDATIVGLGSQGTVTVGEASSQTVYYLGPRQARGAADLPQLRRALRVELMTPGGEPLALRPYATWNEQPVDQGGGPDAQAVAVWTVHFPNPGDYPVEVGSVEGVDDADGAVLIAESSESTLARWGLLALGSATLGLVLGGLWAGLLAASRGRARRPGWRHGAGPSSGADHTPLAAGVTWGPAGPVVVPPPPAGYEPRPRPAPERRRSDR